MSFGVTVLELWLCEVIDATPFVYVLDARL